MIDFIILGAQKAATSALQASIRNHPSIYMPEGESPFFEEPDYFDSPWLNFAKEQPSSVIKGIKRPDYLCSETALERIKEALPHCKFIVVLREPVSRAVSSYCYMVRHAHLPAKPLNTGMQECLEAFEKGCDNRAASVISYGLYGAYLNKWINEFGRDRFLIISQNEVGTSLCNVLDRCLQHLGISRAQGKSIINGREESNVGLYDPKLLKIARIASLIKTKKITGTYRRQPRVLPLRAIGVVISRYAEFLARHKGQTKELLNDEIESRLSKIYAEEAMLLSKIVEKSNFKWIKQ